MGRIEPPRWVFLAPFDFPARVSWQARLWRRWSLLWTWDVPRRAQGLLWPRWRRRRWGPGIEPSSSRR